MKKFFDRVRLFDGSMGALLGQMGYNAACPDEMTVSHPEVIFDIHRKYVEAGADVIICDSFGSTEMALAHKKKSGMGPTFAAKAVEIARAAADGRAYVAADFGPTSEFMYPVGEKTFEDFYRAFREQAASARGADFGIIETQTDLAECRAACLALRDAGLMPLASFSVGANGRTLTGSPAECCALALQAAGAFALGLNCAAGPEELLKPLEKMRAVSPLPVVVQPNAGLPRSAPDGGVTYPYDPETVARFAEPLLRAGASGIGGCCGTTPAHIAAIRPLAGGSAPAPAWDGQTRVCSARSFALLSDALLRVCPLDDPEDAYDLDGDATMALVSLCGKSPDDAREETVLSAAATRLPLMFRAGGDDLCALEAALRVYPGVACVDAPASAEEIIARYGAIRV